VLVGMLRVLDQCLTSDEVTAKASVLRQSANALTWCDRCRFGTLFSCQMMPELLIFVDCKTKVLLRADYVMVYVYALNYPSKRSRFRVSNTPSNKGRASQHFMYTVVINTGNVLLYYHKPYYIIRVQRTINLLKSSGYYMQRHVEI
jgi:hypothetical protein